jgi:hypothetical protein
MAEITITIKIDGNAVTVTQNSAQASSRTATPETAPRVVRKVSLPSSVDDGSGGTGSDTSH